MALIDQRGFIHDAWHSIDDDAPLAGETKVLISLQRYVEAVHDRSGGKHREGKASFGIRIANNTVASDLVDILDAVDLVAIEFPGSADGRGFSLARQLRELGFGGELRAIGPLIADQFAFAIACGFDTLQVPAAMAARQPEAQWRAALASIDSVYQANYGGGATSILEQRAAARAATPRATRIESMDHMFRPN